MHGYVRVCYVEHLKTLLGFSMINDVMLTELEMILPCIGDCGGRVVKVLCYKSEGRWFDSRWCHWNFSLSYSFRSHYGLGVDSASDRNKYQEHFLGVKAAGA